MKTSVVIIEDEVQIRRLLRKTLEEAGYDVHEAAAGQLGIDLVAAQRPGVVLLDLGLPDMDGLSVLQRLREWTEVPVVVLSVRDSDEDKVSALDAGAEDYVNKPFSTMELLARLRAAQRKTRHTVEEPVIRIRHLTVDLAMRRVYRSGQEVKLTPVEYALLRQLVKHTGRVLTHRQILRSVWGPNSEEHRLYLRVYVNHLRNKIEKDPSAPTLIQTEYGIGYRIAVHEEGDTPEVEEDNTSGLSGKSAESCAIQQKK